VKPSSSTTRVKMRIACKRSIATVGIGLLFSLFVHK
jgi:hypothetical protein